MSDDTTSGDGARVITRRRVVIGAIVAAVLVAAGSVYLARPDVIFGPQAEAGEFLSDPTSRGADYSVKVSLPWGDLDIAASKPVEHIDDTVLYSSKFDANLHEIDPPDDGSWVTLKVAPDIGFGEKLFRSRADATIPATTVSVLSGGRTLPIVRAAGGGKQSTTQVISAQLAPAVEGYFALPERPRDLHLRVDFDGVRQDVYPYRGKVISRQAKPLYATAAKRIAVECSRPVVPGYRPGYTITGTCTMNRLLHLPYVAGLGWAKPGRTWLVTTVRSLAPRQLFRTAPSGQRGAYYSDFREAPQSRLRYGTTAPRAQAAYNSVKASVFLDVDSPQQFVFDVPATDDGSETFTLTNRFTAELSGTVPGLPLTPVLTSTRTIRVPVS